jgi:hypothetical protein
VPAHEGGCGVQCLGGDATGPWHLAVSAPKSRISLKPKFSPSQALILPPGTRQQQQLNFIHCLQHFIHFINSIQVYFFNINKLLFFI